MLIRLIDDLRQEEHIKSYITQQSMKALSVQEHTLREDKVIASSYIDMLDTLTTRSDLALIAQTSLGDIVGYALLTEHKNTWVGSVEGFIYALGIEQYLLDSPYILEFLDAIRNWGTRHEYSLIRLEVGEDTQFQALIDHLQTYGYVTSGLVPCKILSASKVREGAVSSYITEDIQIRAGEEEDYPFVVQLLTEAVWAGLSVFEKTQVSMEMLLENIRQEYEVAFRDGSSWCYIAETVDKTFCGHATVMLHIHPVLDIIEAELVDTFVLSAFNGHSISGKLTTQALMTCMSQGISFVRGFLGSENASQEHVQRIRLYLEHNGWWMNSRMMYLRLA